MKAFEIMNYLEQYFPLSLQMDFDCCGLQLGNPNQEINKVYLALNADNDSLQQCLDHGCQMLITHHPFLLEKIKTLDYSLHQGAFVQKAVINQIVVYSLHTCLDRGQNGISMNDWLINKLNVKDVVCYDDYQIGKMAMLKQPLPASKFISEVQEAFALKHLRYAGRLDKIISKIAICGGSGGDDLELLAKQVDCYITGDTKYRHAKYAIDHDCLLIDPGHHLEVIFEAELAKLLQPLGIEVLINDSKDYYSYL